MTVYFPSRLVSGACLMRGDIISDRPLTDPQADPTEREDFAPFEITDVWRQPDRILAAVVAHGVPSEPGFDNRVRLNPRQKYMTYKLAPAALHPVDAVAFADGADVPADA